MAAINYAISLIKKRGKIPFNELLKLVEREYPDLNIGRVWLGKQLVARARQAEIERWITIIEGKHVVMYGVKGVRKVKQCRICGEEIHPKAPLVCSKKCEKELEKIVNFYIPLPNFK